MPREAATTGRAQRGGVQRRRCRLALALALALALCGVCLPLLLPVALLAHGAPLVEPTVVRSDSAVWAATLTVQAARYSDAAVSFTGRQYCFEGVCSYPGQWDGNARRGTAVRGGDASFRQDDAPSADARCAAIAKQSTTSEQAIAHESVSESDAH